MRRTILFIILVCFLPACAAGPDNPPGAADSGTGRDGIELPLAEREKLCRDFVLDEMVTEQGGIRTNYLDKPHRRDYATGAEVLSESMGLVMLYAVGTGDEALFQRSLAFVEEYLDTGTIFAYRYGEGGAYHVNAFVDDIRIVRTLILAGDVFDEGYLDTAWAYGDRLYETNIRDDRIYDMYDERYRTRNDFITLCYVDLDTVNLLAAHDERWTAVYDRMLDIALGGYISDDVPLYASSYSYGNGRYSCGDINMIEATLTALNLAKAGQCPPQTISYLRERIENGAIYGAYSHDGIEQNTIESTAVYAICALLAEEAGDEDMYAMCIEKMDGFQVMDQGSEVYGAFANPVSLDLYSYDNLMALLAYRRVR